MKSPPVSELKQQAKRLREALSAMHVSIGHGQALELIARQHACKDWNTLHAQASEPQRYAVEIGQRVTGAYLGNSFTGTVTGQEDMGGDGHCRVAVKFDEPVDVVKFRGMSNLRSRISCVITSAGVTVEKTSDGQPQLSIKPL